MNKGITFFLGLLIGILICVALYYLDSKKIKAIIHKQDRKEKEVVTQVKKDTVYVDAQQTKKTEKVNLTFVGEIEEIRDDERALYETEFSYDENDNDEVFADRLLQTKTVKVKLYATENQEEKLPDNGFQVFEIQHWSTPIKNKITYYRNKNMIKIKGMEVDKVSVVFLNDTYFLEIENRYYAIPETDSFEKLNIVKLPK
jgi:uncharacterized protein YhbP (UPF0306 family)